VGPVEGLQVVDVEPPMLRPRSVRVQVACAGLNYVDALFVEGRYQIKPPTPFVPGSEIAGIVTEVADDVESVSVGDRVLASCGLGGFAEEVVVPVGSVAHVPPTMSLTAASTMTQSYCTALFALRDRAALRSGEQVLVLGAGGGVGFAAIQVARALGASVIACASSEEKRAHAASAGAVTVFEANPSTLKDLVREASNGGVDVVVDPVGDVLADPALRILREKGRYLVIGFAGGAIPSLPANQILLRNRSVVGVDWGAWAMTHGVEQNELLGEVLAMAEEGVLSPPEPRTYGFDEAPRALWDLMNRAVTGKAALQVRTPEA